MGSAVKRLVFELIVETPDWFESDKPDSTKEERISNALRDAVGSPECLTVKAKLLRREHIAGGIITLMPKV